jgi:cell filamentation protein
MSYTAGSDPLCYFGSNVLKNKLGILDQSRLDEFEHAVYLARFEQAWPSGQMDVAHYLALHRHLFQDVYDWAGAIRSIRIGKDGNWFCFPEHIEGQMEKLFGQLAGDEHLGALSGADFAGKAARFLSELNAIHPFREGNGRVQMSFLTLLADNAGLPFNTAALEPQRAMQAMIESFKGRPGPLERLILDLVGQD